MWIVCLGAHFVPCRALQVHHFIQCSVLKTKLGGDGGDAPPPLLLLAHRLILGDLPHSKHTAWSPAGVACLCLPTGLYESQPLSLRIF